MAGASNVIPIREPSARAQAELKKWSDYLTIEQTAARCKAEGIPLSSYSIRKLVHNNQIPFAALGDKPKKSSAMPKVLIYWPNIIAYLQGTM